MHDQRVKRSTDDNEMAILAKLKSAVVHHNDSPDKLVKVMQFYG